MTNTTDTSVTNAKSGFSAQSMTFDEMLEHSRQRMEQVQPTVPTRVAFTWRNRRFTAHVDRVNDSVSGQFRVRIVGDFGPIPYTAENRSKRSKVTKLVEWHGDFGDFRLVTTTRNRLSIIGMRQFPSELDGLSILSALVSQLSEMAPFVDIAEEICLAAGIAAHSGAQHLN